MTEIGNKYAGLGGSRGWLGPPTDEGERLLEMAIRNGLGRFCDFQNGTIYFKPSVGAFEVHGDIRVKWVQLGGEEGFLGFSATDETGTPDRRGRFNHFEGGDISWTPEGGTTVGQRID